MRIGSLAVMAALLVTSATTLSYMSKGGATARQQPQASEEMGHPQSGDNGGVALAGTELLTRRVSEDIREEQRQQIIRYFQAQIAATPAQRDRLWRPDFSSPAAYRASIQAHRVRLRAMLGLIEFHPGTPLIEVVQENASIKVEDVTLPIEPGFSAHALVFMPKSARRIPSIIAIPPETASREEFAGIMSGKPPALWLSALLARNVAVAVPITVERRNDDPLCQLAGGNDERRMLWRAGFIVGRSLVGLEVQQVLALRTFLSSLGNLDAKRIAVLGEAQGGMTALYAGAVDEKFAGVAVLDYFQSREDCWQEPVDRVLYGQLNEFGDAEVAALIAPRPLLIAHASPSQIPLERVHAEFQRALRFYAGLHASEQLSGLDDENYRSQAAARVAAWLGAMKKQSSSELTPQVSSEQAAVRRNQHFEALLQYLFGLCGSSDRVRADHWQLNSTPMADRPQKVQKLRAELANLMGTIAPDVPMHARSALAAETDKFLAYDVFLDVLPGVEAYGQLLVPRAVAGHSSRRLPAVICQHGFGSAPKDVTGVGKDPDPRGTHRFGERLAERGYVVFAPYVTVPEVHAPPAMGGKARRADLINPLVRLAAAVGMMRTSIELAKLHRIIDFLQSLPFVDSHQIGYYGISYGGYCATWMPPLEPRLKLTTIAAFFNDWRPRLIDTVHAGATYWNDPDEDFYNWNALNRFTHVELIAAMWPRPVCIEQGNADQVTTPEWHERAWKQLEEFSRSWDMEGKIVNDAFIGPHTIHGIGTFFFLDRWLRPERPAGRDYGCRDDNYCYQNMAPDFHGYAQTSTEAVPFVTQLLDADPGSTIQGQFYVSKSLPVLRGIALKLARKGQPGDLLVRFGSSEESDDLGHARIPFRDVYPLYDLWYEAPLAKPVRLEPSKLYYFKIGAESGQAPNDCYTVFGPMPLGAKDFPRNFGLSFRILGQQGE